MRALLILVCTISVSVTGCKTSTSNVECGAVCGCAAPCGVALIETERPEEVAQIAPEEVPAIVEIEQVKSSVAETVNPFNEPVAEPEPEPIPVPEYGHGENYRWLLGHLQRVHSPQHQWKIRYAPLDENDEWGGSMVLSTDARLDQFKDGDAVYVEGEVLTGRASLYLSGPLYRVRVIRQAHELTHITPRSSR